VGGLLVIRRPGSPIGVSCSSPGLTAISWGGGYYVGLGDYAGPRPSRSRPFAWLSAGFTRRSGSWPSGCVYPTGHLPDLAGDRRPDRDHRDLSAAGHGHGTRSMSNFDTIINPVVPPQPFST
jgi:hypothetical protein